MIHIFVFANASGDRLFIEKDDTGTVKKKGGPYSQNA